MHNRNLSNRLKKRLQMTMDSYNLDKKFSKKYAIYHVLDDIFWCAKFKKMALYFHSKKDKWIIDYLNKQYEHILNKYVNCREEGVKLPDAPIWVCWWSGVESAPLLVKQCIKSIQQNAGKHPVYIITEKNYQEYISVPDYIMDKVRLGSMCLANFSDYLRVSLLYKYGGLWLDATIYCSKEIPEAYFENPIFTCKSKYKESRYISGFQWTSFCLGGWKNNLFYKIFKECFEEYWKYNDCAIDYLLVDYTIKCILNHNEKISTLMKHIPINNIHRDDLQEAMNNAEDACKVHTIIKDDTVLYKLSWRENYSEYSTNGEKTIYYKFINGDLI